MLKAIDNFLDGITMYRLVLYYLIALLAVGAALAFLGILPFTVQALAVSTIIILTASWITNKIFSKVFEAPTNVESFYITAFILILVITPTLTFQNMAYFFWVAVLAMASKYIVARNKRHLFNPTAFSLVIVSIGITHSPTWWVGSASMLAFVIIGGLLVVRKIRRFTMVLTFLAVALAVMITASTLRGTDLITGFQKAIADSPLLFFAFIMLTEPFTTPPRQILRIIYASIVALLFAPQLNFFGFSTTPESALVLGNIFSYLVSSKSRLALKLKEKIQIAPDIYDFVFSNSQKLAFLPGQYFEWTLGYKNPDSRGNRRYFTIASSPTEENLRIGVKFYPEPSGFKKALSNMNDQKEIMAGQLAGDFTLPGDPGKKLTFIAGGIGVTPFRSMIKYLLDKGEKRPITMFFSNKVAPDIVYKDIFDKAEKELGIKTIYVLTDLEKLPKDWKGKTGYINEQMLKEEVPDFKDRIFYLSGPHSMVAAFQNTLAKMGVSNTHIKTDFFSGYA